MALERGTRFGPYEIVAPLGAGGMGEVYRARDPRLDRDVAIKVLPASVSADADRLQRFEQEARATAALNHPNIIAVHDIGTHPSTDSGQAVPYIVSELLDGETLRQRLDQSGGPHPPRKAIEYAVQLARGLAAAHDKGIVHRDLKPENVFVTSDGHVKILDFGLAKLIDPQPALSGLSQMATTPQATKSGVMLGTIGYMAPEQVRGQPVDHRADIFAFGAILHEMLSGRRAFGEATAVDTLSAILEKHPGELPVSGQIPPAVARIVDRCLEKNPAARFQSTRDLTFALEALDSNSGATTLVAPAAAHRARARWLLPAAASMTSAILAFTAAQYVRRGVEHREMTRLDVVTPATSDSVAGFALSTDGSHLAFVAADGGVPRLWIRSLDDTTARPLAGTDGAQYPFWAPHGHALAFFAEGKLKRIDLTSGTSVTLANTASPRGGAWSGDDVILFAPATTGGLWRVPAAGGAVTAVTELETGQVSHRFPAFLDNRRFLFLITLGQAATRGIYVGSLDGGRPTRILETGDVAAAFAPPDTLLILSQGVLTARRFDARNPTQLGEPVALADGFQISGTFGLAPFSASATGTLAYKTHVSVQRQLVWLDRAGKMVAEAAPPDADGQSVMTLAPDDRSVAHVRLLQANADVWVRDLGRHTLARFTFDPSIDASPVWSPNGDRIVFYSNRGGTPNLFEKPIDGSVDERVLLETDQAKGPLDWSSDGRFLLFASQDPRTLCDIWALPMSGERPSTGSGRPEPAEGRKPFPVVQTAADDVHGRFSPDGRWMAYASNETGRYEVYARPFPGPGARQQLSTAGGIYPVWRRDGKELYYIAPDNRMMSVAIDATTTLRPGTPAALFPTNLATGGNVGISGSNARAEYAVAADGRFLLNVRIGDAASSPITIMQNWDMLLKR